MVKYLLSENIKSLADSIGIDVVGFAEASEFTSNALNHHQRRYPKLTLPNAKSIIIAGIYIGRGTLPAWENAWYGRTSRLYLSGFFLDVVKPLAPIAEFLRQKGYQTKICDGSIENGSILPLKLAAIRAGLGWQGKHSLLISKKFGTFLALGGIITDADLDHNTIEICQDSCPWNRRHLKSALVTKMTDHFQKKIEEWGDSFYLPNLSRLSENGYKDMFGHLNTGISYDLFHRNV